MVRVALALVVVATLLAVPPVAPAGVPAVGAPMLPDMRTVVPQHLGVVNPAKGAKKEILRFSNGVVNTGDGPWRMRPRFPLGDVSQPQEAVQEILDSADSTGNIVQEKLVSQFEWHETHKHWHIKGIALFEFRVSKGGAASTKDIGEVYGGNSLKTTFCLIDWIRYEGNSNTGKKTDRVYFDCHGAYQGVSVGWVDQYHQATDGQELDITNAPVGYYYLLSTTNAESIFVEKDLTNNFAWVFLELTRDSQGNAKIEVITDSVEAEGVGLADTYSPNR